MGGPWEGRKRGAMKRPCARENSHPGWKGVAGNAFLSRMPGSKVSDAKRPVFPD